MEALEQDVSSQLLCLGFVSLIKLQCTSVLLISCYLMVNLLMMEPNCSLRMTKSGILTSYDHGLSHPVAKAVVIVFTASLLGLSIYGNYELVIVPIVFTIRKLLQKLPHNLSCNGLALLKYKKSFGSEKVDEV